MNPNFPAVSCLVAMVVRLFQVIDSRNQRIALLLCELKEAHQKIRQLESVVNNTIQLGEAYGDDNRNYFREKFGRLPTDEEALIYYIENGGATGHSKRMKEKKPRRGLAVI